MAATSANPALFTTEATDKITSREIEFIDSDEFRNLKYTPRELRLVDELTSAPVATGHAKSDNALGSVLRESRAPLTADQERILFRRMNFTRFRAESIRSRLSAEHPSEHMLDQMRALLKEADQIRRCIVESNIRLVVSIARRFTSATQDLQELVSDGLLILLRAVEKFDYSRGFRFSTYATHSVQRHYFRSIQQSQKYHQRFALTPGEVMAGVAEHVEQDVVEGQDETELLNRLMGSAEGKLNQREEDILHRRFGTAGLGVTQTLREIAAELGISKERVRQIQIAALAKLREVASEMNLAPSAG